MEIQEIYNQFRGYYGELEAEYAHCQKASMEWESLHLRYLIYYLMRYGIGEMKFFNAYHYRVAYRWYLQSLMPSSAWYLESGTEIGNWLEFDFVVPPPHSWVGL